MRIKSLIKLFVCAVMMSSIECEIIDMTNMTAKILHFKDCHYTECNAVTVDQIEKNNKLCDGEEVLEINRLNDEYFHCFKEIAAEKANENPTFVVGFKSMCCPNSSHNFYYLTLHDNNY